MAESAWGKWDGERPLLLDAGFATELERLGYDISSDLWSAELLLNNNAAIVHVHKSFLRAGADVLLTSAYQASVQRFIASGYSEQQGIKALVDSTALAFQAIEEEKADALVFASIGPYGAHLADGSEYSGKYGTGSVLPPMGSTSPTEGTENVVGLKAGLAARLSAIANGLGMSKLPCDLRVLQELSIFHASKVHRLLSAEAVPHGVAFETLPCFSEVLAAVAVMSACFPSMPYYVSVSIRSAEELRTGERLTEVVQAALQFGGAQLVGFGVNCCHPEHVECAVCAITRAVKERQPAAPAQRVQEGGQAAGPGTEMRHRFRILAYPNSGEGWDAAARKWYAVKAEEGKEGQGQELPTPSDEGLGKEASQWILRGASVIGGCCRTTKNTIEALKRGMKPDK